MSALGAPRSVSRAAIPELEISVRSAQAARYAAVPTVRFGLHIDAGGRPIRSILLDTQIQISARQRGYGAGEEARLEELFGTPERWRETLRTLPWTRTTTVVPPFEGSTELELAIACSYDLEVAGARYLAALGDGMVPLEFLFSGSVFYTSQGSLQTSRIASACEAAYQLPVSVWREAIDRHFPGSAWLRVRREQFDALCAYKARNAFASWEETFDALLDQRGPDGR